MVEPCLLALPDCGIPSLRFAVYLWTIGAMHGVRSLMRWGDGLLPE
jgi:hypothetical protein